MTPDLFDGDDVLAMSQIALYHGKNKLACCLAAVSAAMFEGDEAVDRLANYLTDYSAGLLREMTEAEVYQRAAVSPDTVMDLAETALSLGQDEAYCWLRMIATAMNDCPADRQRFTDYLVDFAELRSREESRANAERN